MADYFTVLNFGEPHMKNHLYVLLLTVIFLGCGDSIPTVKAHQTFTEIETERTLTGKVFSLNDSVRVYTSSITSLHYDSFGTIVNLDYNQRRINNAKLDGWVVTVGAWHYALGKPDSINGEENTDDGWVGFGGKKGQHYLKFRLSQVIYFHNPSKTIQDIGGAPTYNRANLSRVNDTKSMLDESTMNVSSTATWNNIWTTPGGGELSISWRLGGDGLKEEITINQAGREWIAANRPPDSTASETYFGFLFEIDISDVPRVFKNNVEQVWGNDIDDNETDNIELRNAANELLAFMPVGNIEVQGVDVSPPNRPPIEDFNRPLRKLFYRQGGNDFLLVGIRVDRINSMISGDLVFDPTSGPTAIANNVDDGENNNGTWSVNGSISNRIYNFEEGSSPEYGGFSWTLPNIPATATIDSMYMSMSTSDDNLSALVIRVGIEDSDPATAVIWSSSHNQTGPSETWIETIDATSTAYSNDTRYWGEGDTAPYVELGQGLTDLLSSYGNITSGDRINIGTWPPNNDNSTYMSIEDFNDAASNEAAIYIRWTLAAEAVNRRKVISY